MGETLPLKQQLEFCFRTMTTETIISPPLFLRRCCHCNFFTTRFPCGFTLWCGIARHVTMHVVFTLSCRDKHIMPIFPPIMLPSYAQFLSYHSVQGAHIILTVRYIMSASTYQSGVNPWLSSVSHS